MIRYTNGKTGRMRACALAILLCFAALAGCGTPGSGGRLTVTALFYPIYAHALNVCADVPGVRVVCVAPTSAGCLHDYSLSAGDVLLVEQADIVLLNGAGLEAAFEKTLIERGALVADLSEPIALLESGGEYHDDEDEDEDEHDHEHNPHIWISPRQAIEQVRAIRDALVALDPEHAAQYTQNAAAYIGRLEAVDAEYREKLAPYAGQMLVSPNQTFSYLLNDYGIELGGALYAHSEQPLSPGDVRTLIDLCAESGAKGVLAEAENISRTVRSVAEQAGVPLVSLTAGAQADGGEPESDTLLRAYRGNLAALLEVFER